MADTSRRTLHVRLESPDENPEERADFHHTPLGPWLRQERPRLVSAALTILAGYHTAGRPNMALRPWGSFEAWSDLVRSSIVWAGLPDPGDTRQELAEQSDMEGAALRSLIDGWALIDPEGLGLPVASVLDAIADCQKRSVTMPAGYDEVRNALVEMCPAKGAGLPSARSVGMKLNHLRRRIAGGRYLDRKADCHGNYWLVRSADIVWTNRTKRTNPSPSQERNNNEHIYTRIRGEENSPLSPPSSTNHNWRDMKPDSCPNYRENLDPRFPRLPRPKLSFVHLAF